MTIRRDRMIGICDEIIARKLKISWQTPNGIRASVTDEEMLIKMRQSGCVHITLAPESGSERVVKEFIQKGDDFSPRPIAQGREIRPSVGNESCRVLHPGDARRNPGGH